jgi:hypothetical protein
MLTLTFATANDVFADYAGVLVWGAVVIVLTIIVLGAANKDTPSEVSLATATKIGLFAYALLAVVSYRTLYGNFISAEIDENSARFYFDGALSHSTTLKRDEIKDVLYATPGKTKPYSCYLKFTTRSGDEYRSATTPGDACKEQRNQIISLLRLN